MNKLLVSLTITVVVLGFFSGFLFHQLNDAYSLNNELLNQNVEAQNQLNELQTQNNELETQITELQNQNSELRNQLTDQQYMNIQLQNQIDEEQNKNDELKNQTESLQLQISEVQDQLNVSQNQTSYLQNQVSEQLEALSEVTYELALERHLDVLVSKFDWDWSFSPLGGLTVMYPVNVTVSNIDVTALGGLTLNVRLFRKGSLIELKGSRGFSAQIGNIQAKESREISGIIFATLGTISPDTAVCAIELSVRGIVVDERIYKLPAFPQNTL